jgi:integrase
LVTLRTVDVSEQRSELVALLGSRTRLRNRGFAEGLTSVPDVIGPCRRISAVVVADSDHDNAGVAHLFDAFDALVIAFVLPSLLSISGPRPGEIYALDWSAVYLDVEKPYFRIERTWCSKGFRFYAPKTEAGRRTVRISAWLASVLREHRASSGSAAAVDRISGTVESR